MKRLLSIFMMFCLLNVSIYGAVADLAQAVLTPSDTYHHTVTIPDSKEPLHKAPTLSEKARAVYTSFKHGLNTVIQDPIGGMCAFIGTIAVGLYSVICLALFIGSFCDGIPFSMLHTIFWGGEPQAFARPDYCINPALMDQNTGRIARYQHLKQGSLPLAEVLPHWLNNDQNLMALLGGAVLQSRYYEPTLQKSWPTFQSDASTLLRAHGFPHDFQTISCDVILGNNTGSDQLANCQHENPPEHFRPSDVTPGTHAKLWIIKWPWNAFSQEFRLIPAAAPSEQVYPVSDTSPDYGRVDADVRRAARRALIQSDNTLSLPDALQNWLGNAQHWLDGAFSIADQLRHQKCPISNETEELSDLTANIFDAQQARLTNGTLRCDLDIATDILQVTGCMFDFAPTDYNHDTHCDMHSHLHFPRDGAIWFIPNSHETFKKFLIATHRFIPTTTEAPTTLAPTTMTQPTTLQPTTTLRPTTTTIVPTTTTQPTTPQLTTMTVPTTTTVPTTLVPTTTTQPTTLEPTTTTIPTTTVVPTTAAPVQNNTTTRMYWVRMRSAQLDLPSTIWGADIDPVTGVAGEPWVFLTEPDVVRPCAMYYDAKNGFFYWSEEVVVAGNTRSNLNVARVNQTGTKRATLYNTTLLDNTGNGYGSIFIDDELGVLYWQYTTIQYITSTINPKEPWRLNKQHRNMGGDIGTIAADYSTVSFKSKWIVFGIHGGANSLNTGSMGSDYQSQNVTRFRSPPVVLGSCYGVFFHTPSRKLFFTGFHQQSRISAIYSADIINPTTLALTNISLMYNTTNRTIIDGGNSLPSTIVIDEAK
jgi:hypothetical protein